MRFELRRIGIWSLTRVSFFFHAIAGLVMGFACALMIGLWLAVLEHLPARYDTGYGTEAFPVGVMLIIVPIACSVGGGVFGTIGTIVLAFVYNLIARLTGGIELDLAEVTITTPPAPVDRTTPGGPAPSGSDMSVAPPPPPPVAPQSSGTDGDSEPSPMRDNLPPETDRTE